VIAPSLEMIVCATLGNMTTATRYGSLAGSLALVSLSALHLSWAAGFTWPASDETRLAESVAGLRQMPSTMTCVVVGGGLGFAAAAVAGLGGSDRSARVLRSGIALGFIIRGVAGVTGKTNRLVSWQPSSHFITLDRRYYGPLCLMIGAAAAASITGPPH
jgi:hypothetical protein